MDIQKIMRKFGLEMTEIESGAIEIHLKSYLLYYENKEMPKYRVDIGGIIDYTLTMFSSVKLDDAELFAKSFGILVNESKLLQEVGVFNYGIEYENKTYKEIKSGYKFRLIGLADEVWCSILKERTIDQHTILKEMFPEERMKMLFNKEGAVEGITKKGLEKMKEIKEKMNKSEGAFLLAEEIGKEYEAYLSQEKT